MRIVSKKRFLTTTIGIILAVAMIFSTFTLGNNMSKVEIYNAVHEMKIHAVFSGVMNASKFDIAMNEISNISHVVLTQGYIELSANNNTDYYNLFYQKNMMNLKIIDGRLPKDLNEVAVFKESAEYRNMSIGSKINITNPNNCTLTVVGIFESYNLNEYNEYNGGAEYTPLNFDFYTNPQTMSQFGSANFYIGIKVNPDYLISSGDINEMHRKMFNIEQNVNSVISKYGNIYQIEDRTQYVGENSQFSIIFALVFALPVIVIGAYLSKVGIEIDLLERKREFGILRIRGAGSLQRFKFLIYEAIIYSIIGGIAGYLLGEFIAYISNISLFHLPFFILDINSWSLISSIFISLFLFFIALYKPWKKIKNTPLLELITHYSQEFKKPEYSLTKDVVLSIIFWGYLILGIYIFRTTNLYGGFNLLVIIAFIIAITLIFMLPLILIVLPLTTARLITLGFPRIYEYISLGITKLMKTSGDIVKKSVRRNPKNVAYLAFILAFLLTLATFMSVIVDNESFIAEIQDAQTVGGDFNVKSNSNSIKDILNSKNVSSYAFYTTDSNAYIYGSYSTVAFTKFDNYSKSVYYLKYFIEKGKLTENGVAITEDLKKNYGIDVGDVIKIALIPEGEVQNLTYKDYKITCVMSSFPGLNGDVLLNKDVSPENASGVIIKSANFASVKKQLDNAGVYYEYKGSANSMSTGTNYTEILLIYLIILGASAIFVVQYSLYFNRRGEIALYRVRGARRHQAAGILMAEGITVIIISLIIGIVVGFALSYFILSIQSASSHLPSIFIIGMNFLISIVTMVLIFLLSHYILSLKFASVNVDEIIREIGGEM